MIPVIVYDPEPDLCSRLRQFIANASASLGEAMRLLAGTCSEKDAAAYIEASREITLVILGIGKNADDVFELGRKALKANRDNYIVYLLHSNSQLDVLIENCLRPAGIVMHPYDDSKLNRIITRIQADYSNMIGDEDEDYLVLTGSAGTHRLPMKKILYVEASEKKVTIWTERQSITVRMTMGMIEEMLPKSRFLRCHRSYIVNREWVSEVDYANMLIRLIGGEEVYISRSLKNEVRQAFEGKAVNEDGV